jgi:hypothetical protein
MSHTKQVNGGRPVPGSSLTRQLSTIFRFSDRRSAKGGFENASMEERLCPLIVNGTLVGGLPLPSRSQYPAPPFAWLVQRCEARDENNAVPACDRACSSPSVPPCALLRVLDPHVLLETALLRSRSHPLGSDASTKSSLQFPPPHSVVIFADRERSCKRAYVRHQSLPPSADPFGQLNRIAGAVFPFKPSQRVIFTSGRYPYGAEHYSL